MMQRAITAKIAQQTGLELVSFRHYDCLLFSRGEFVKLFMPETTRVLGCPPEIRGIRGNLIVASAADWKPLRPPSKRYEQPEIIFSTLTENFSSLVLYSSLRDDRVEQEYFDYIAKLLAALPDDRAGWERELGDDIFSISPWDQFSRVNSHLRKNVCIEKPQWSKDLASRVKVEVTIETPTWDV